jgi:hypothetical protein
MPRHDILAVVLAPESQEGRKPGVTCRTTSSRTDHLIASGWAVNYVEVPVDEKKRKAKRASHTKYQCPSCAIQVRGKPDISVTCTECRLIMPKINED